MYHDFYAGRSILDLPILAMFLFALTFAVVVVRALVQGRTDPRQQHLSQLPLLEAEAVAPAPDRNERQP